MKEINVASQYDRFAGLYDLFFAGILNPGRKKVLEKINALPAAQVLEIGVGTGISLNEYAGRHYITGIDISEKMVEKARKRCERYHLTNTHMLQMDAEQLRFPDNSFDVVVALYVVSTVNHPQQLMREMERVCKPGGRIFIVNHFSGRWAALEKWVLPITSCLGWKSYFEKGQIALPSLRLTSARRINLFGYWQLLEFEANR